MVYGKYVAKEPIDFNGVRAFQPGDPVPEDSVTEHGWGDLVEEITGTPEPAPDTGKATGPAAAKKAGGSRGTSSGD